ncbi:hypothetical protein [Paenibacillus kyungheensis]
MDKPKNEEFFGLKISMVDKDNLCDVFPLSTYKENRANVINEISLTYIDISCLNV